MENVSSVRFVIAVNKSIFCINVDILFLIKLFKVQKYSLLQVVILVDYQIVRLGTTCYNYKNMRKKFVGIIPAFSMVTKISRSWAFFQQKRLEHVWLDFPYLGESKTKCILLSKEEVKKIEFFQSWRAETILDHSKEYLQSWSSFLGALHCFYTGPIHN